MCRRQTLGSSPTYTRFPQRALVEDSLPIVTATTAKMTSQTAWRWIGSKQMVDVVAQPHCTLCQALALVLATTGAADPLTALEDPSSTCGLTTMRMESSPSLAMVRQSAVIHWILQPPGMTGGLSNLLTSPEAQSSTPASGPVLGFRQISVVAVLVIWMDLTSRFQI